jgi:hypothetical protein
MAAAAKGARTMDKEAKYVISILRSGSNAADLYDFYGEFETAKEFINNLSYRDVLKANICDNTGIIIYRRGE